MFKKRARPNSASARQRDEEGDGESGAVPVAEGPKRVRLTGGSSSSTGGTDSGLIGASTKRSELDTNAKIEAKLADTTLSGIKATGVKGLTPADDITRRMEVDTELDQDNRAVQERNQEIHKGLKDGTLEKGVYRGLKGYMQYAEKGEGAIHASKFNGLLGPIRNSLSNVRSTLRVEYWGVSGDGGICKDYKETGYCGYGDGCKFMHDRGDYKQGFHLDREWEAKQKAIEAKKRERWEKRLQKRVALKEAGKEVNEDEESSSQDSNDDSDAELPTACPACDNKWENCSSIPIQTVCGHYFCEDCAMTNFAKSPTCMACDRPTNGIFNSCDALEAKIKQKKADREAKRKKKQGESQARGPSVQWQVHVDT